MKTNDRSVMSTTEKRQALCSIAMFTLLYVGSMLAMAQLFSR